MISLAFPFQSPDSLCVFAKIRCKNPFMLSMAIDNFLMGVNQLGNEGEFTEELWDSLLKVTPIRIAPLNDSCLIVADLKHSEVGQYIEEMIGKYFDIVKQVKPNISAEIGLGRSIKDLLAFVD